MPVKKINQNPTSSDIIQFDILTSDLNGCLMDPYKVDKVTIYFVERNFATGNPQLYEKQVPNPALESEAQDAEQTACLDPTDENIAKAQSKRALANASIQKSNVYFTNAVPIKTIGSPDYPAWLSTDTENSPLYHDIKTFGTGLDGKPITKDPNTNQEVPIPGHFLFDWDSQGAAREGDYFLCWTWTPYPAGNSLTAHTPFFIQGNTELTQSIPTHFTVPGKYETLMERYLPEMFKLMIAPGDLTPDVLEKLNKSIAQGFTTVENLANQLIDILDANSCHEILLPYLSNLFNLKLKSGDPTLWRRQIKRAIPLFKKKGTFSGLSEAFAQAGMSLKKYTKLYQVVSKYTWNDFFIYGNSNQFITTFSPINSNPVGDSNYHLQVRAVGTTEWVDYNTSNLSWGYNSDNDPVVTVDLDLQTGDQILIRYVYNSIPGTPEQTIETYVQSLYLTDLREEKNDGTQILPKKNWNVKVIEEDDPLFDLICEEKHPFEEKVIFGSIRTEFPYSENVWNMDEYNGSNRDSTNPCDISTDFLDECTCCLSSKFVLDVEIENLSDDAIAESQEITKEYVPFHSVLHMLNLSGTFNEFVQPPQEDLEILIQYRFEENVISGNTNEAFNRWRGTGYNTPTQDSDTNDNNPFDPDDYLENGTLDPAYFLDVRRNMLAESTVVVSNFVGVGYNDEIHLFCPEVSFDRIGISPNNIIEIFAPSANAGVYVGTTSSGHTIAVNNVAEPLDLAQFTFRISNFIYQNGNCAILQDDVFLLTDSSHASEWSSTSSTTISLTGYGVYTIKEILPGGVLSLLDPTRSLPTIPTNISYTLGTLSGTSNLQVTRRAKVTINHPGEPDVQLHGVKIGYYALIDGVQYKISEFDEINPSSFYVQNYDDGDGSGVIVKIYKRLADNQIGNFNYKGMKLDGLANFEDSLLIQNGSGNPVDAHQQVVSTLPGYPSFKENFLIQINSDYFLISDIKENIVTLSGPSQSWGTLLTGGFPVVFSIIQFSNVTKNLSGIGETLNIDGQEYEFLDRRGHESVHRVINRKPTLPTPLAAMSILNRKEIETAPQEESLTFTIQYQDGTSSSGDL